MEKKNTIEIVKRSGERRHEWLEKGFLGSKVILHDTVIVYTQHYTCFKTHSKYNTKSEP